MEDIGEGDFQWMEMKAYGLLTTLWNYQFVYAMGEV
jgi:hypothetical protein